MGRYLKTSSEVTSTVVDVSQSGFSPIIGGVIVTTSKSITYSKITYENANGEFGSSLNGKGNFSPVSVFETKIIQLGKPNDETFKKLSTALTLEVKDALKTNAQISKNAVKSVFESGKEAEQKATDGKFIPGKGKDNPASNIPDPTNPYNH